MESNSKKCLKALTTYVTENNEKLSKNLELSESDVSKMESSSTWSFFKKRRGDIKSFERIFKCKIKNQIVARVITDNNDTEIIGIYIEND